MLIIYDKITKETISISGIRGVATEREINAIQIADLPETQAEYRIYDNQKIAEIWQALDAGDGIELIFEGEVPTGIQVVDLPDPPSEV